MRDLDSPDSAPNSEAGRLGAFYRLPTSLRRPRNFRGGADLLARLLLQVVLIWSAMLSADSGNWFLFVVLCLVNAFVYSFWGWAGIGHELAHGTVLKSRRLNGVLFVLCGIATWSNHGYFAASHKRHHLNTLSKGDPEDQSDVFLTRREILPLLLMDIRGLTLRIVILARNARGSLPDFGGNCLTLKEENRIKSGARLILVGQFLWATSIVIWVREPELLFLTSFAPWICRLPVTALERLQHLYCQKGSASPFFTTRTVILPRPLRWLYANMNYHVEHHLFPFVPNYNLITLHELLRPQHVEGISLISTPGNLVKVVRSRPRSNSTNVTTSSD